VVVAALFVSAVSIGFLRLEALDFDTAFLVPVELFDVELVQRVEGFGADIDLQTYLPGDGERQRISEQRNSSADFDLKIVYQDGNRLARFHAEHVTGARIVSYAYRVLAKGVRFVISPDYRLGNTPAGVNRKFLEPTETIQSGAPEILKLARSLTPADRSLAVFLRNAFERVRTLASRPFKGTTDALTALRLGEASCNGRSRLMAAVLRAQGVPARLVGGLILRQGVKRTSHQWLEVWIDGHWVPMDPTNDHFAAIPHNYLVLYRGDKVLFKHTADVAFHYQFSIKRRLVPRQQVEQRHRILGFWNAFAELGIPLDLLKVLIMIPLGALVVLIFRNVVGLRTFGTFLPALIAAASRGTGIGWGLLGFLMLILLVSFVRRLLERLELLHSPLLTVLLTTVIGSMLMVAVLGVHLGLNGLPKISLFPVAIMAITSERFAVMEIEDGRRAALATMAQTLVVVFFCYLVMNSLSLQVLMLGFPELLLVVAALAIWLGRWTGLRLSEWLRFRRLLFEKGA